MLDPWDEDRKQEIAELHQEAAQANRNVARLQRELKATRDELRTSRKEVNWLTEVLRQTLELAEIADEGDPWYAQEAGLNADEIRKLARVALDESLGRHVG